MLMTTSNSQQQASDPLRVPFPVIVGIRCK